MPRNAPSCCFVVFVLLISVTFSPGRFAVAQSASTASPDAAPPAGPASPDQSAPTKTGPGNITPPATQPERSIPPPAQQNPVGPAPTSAFEFHGQLFERYRDDSNQHNGARSRRGIVSYGNVSAIYNASSLVSAYIRFGYEGQTPRGEGRDYNTNYYAGDTGYRGAASFDQYGLVYHDIPHGLTINVGRQDEPLDATGTAYDLSYRVGNHTFFDGLSVVKTLGPATVQGYAFSEDQYQTKATRNGLYALRSTYFIVPDFTVGATVGHFASSAVNQAVTIQSTTNTEADVVFKKNATQLTAEYGKSSAQTRNDLYYLGSKYSVTPRDTLNAFTYKIADNADFGHGSGYPNGSRGTRYFLDHHLSQPLEVILYYESNHALYGPGRSTSTQVTFLYSF